jgi:protein required for attachment to host cells
VIDEVSRMVREQGFGHVILVASPKMLGELRRCDAALRKGDLVVDEVAQDLAWLTSPQVHDHLASMKLIDPRPRAPLMRGARTR